MAKLRMQYHPVVTKITDLLKANNCWYETFEHEAVTTSEQAAAVRTGYTLEQGIKAMIVRVKKSDADKKFVMLCLPANLKFDEKKVKAHFGAKDIRLATKDEVTEITNGVQRGGVPPFGNLFNLQVLADPGIFDHDKVIFNAGDRSFSIATNSTDYQKLVSPEIIEIAK